MLQGLYAAATGMAAMEGRQNVLANNIANASTPGFRRQEPLQKGFYGLFSDRLRTPARYNSTTAPGGGVSFTGTFSDPSPGPITVTGNPLDAALSGPGFFAVETPEGQRFTRGGQFKLDVAGQLATADGFKVLDAGGTPIDVPQGTVSIASDGNVMVDGLVIGQLGVTEFANPNALTRQGDNLYAASEAVLATAEPADETLVTQKALEMANVNLPQEMVSMILGMRAYGANQKMINAIDETTQRLIEQVGMPS